MPPRALALRGDADGHWVRRWTGAEWFAQADAWVRARLTSAGIAVAGEPVLVPGTWAEDDPRLDELTDVYLRQWTDLAPLDVLRTELEAAAPLHAVHRLVTWHRLLQYADNLEAATWEEWPRYWLSEVVRLFDPADQGSTSP